MFREMRLKSENSIPQQDAERIMAEGSFGVLAVDGDEGYPYAVPVNYVYSDGKIYFHGANEGHKLDGILKNEKVSFCVVAKDEVVPEKFNTLFLSAIAFGRARRVVDAGEMQQILELIISKYSKGFMDSGKKYIKAEWDNVGVVEIDIEYLTGKKGI